MTDPHAFVPPNPGLVTEGVVLDGRYRLDELIGRGGTAEVYRGTDQVLGRSVAVKVFDARLTDLNTVVRQRNEMQALAQLTHPHLIAVYDARIADSTDRRLPAASDRTYLVLELVDGGTLADLITRGPLPPQDARRVGLTLASVLQTVHGHAMVHRDIKPANILLDASGGIKLGDFGLARILQAEDRPTTGADIMGTAAYFSPEQARAGDAGPPADIYSLGLVLLECLTGRKEFPGEAVAAAVARLLRDPVIPPDLPAPWPALLSGMTARDPQDRPTAAQVRSVLSGSSRMSEQPTDTPLRLSSAPIDGNAETVSWSSPMTPFLNEAATDRRPPSPHRRRLAWTGAGAAVALAAATLWLIAPGDTDAPAATPPVPGMTGPATTAVPTFRTPPSVIGSPTGHATDRTGGLPPSSDPSPVATRVSAPSTPRVTAQQRPTTPAVVGTRSTPGRGAVTAVPVTAAPSLPTARPTVNGPTTSPPGKNNGRSNGKGNGKGGPPKMHGK